MSAPFSLAFPAHQPGADAFALWQAPAGSAALPTGAGEVWRADLPDDPQSAGQLLAALAAQVRRSQNALPLAQLALEHDLRGLTPAAGELSFSTQDSLAPPRAILAAGWSYQAQTRAAAQGAVPAASFGLLDGLPVGKRELDEAADALRSFCAQVSGSVNRLALIETRVNGRKIAVTRAGWSGDLRTWWSAASNPDQRRQHERVVAQALATRQAWTRLLILLTAGTARVAAALAAAPFSPIAIWTTWNYVKEVIRQTQSLGGAPQG